MDINHTQSSNILMSPTFIWCLVMPSIHVFSLISNILCIIVFCSKTFIHKPIAIYFICLLISDSTTLLIGYSEMLDRETSMTDRSSLLCSFNGKIVHNLTDFIYSFMGKFCLEWMLYKVLWTRASTILLAILSIQRTRTFFSLSYRESRFCAVVACLMSVLIASVITCFEWIGVQCDKSTDSSIYMEIFRLITNNTNAKQFYSNFLNDHYNASMTKYSCLIQSFEINRSDNTISPLANQSNCTSTEISSEFYSFTRSLLSNRNAYIDETIHQILTDIYDHNFVHLNTILAPEHIAQGNSPDIILKLFEKRPCHITMIYSICLKLFDFLHSLSFGFNRHTLAIFFGNALPSFIVFLANILSLKVIYFSKSLRYLKQKTQKNRRKRRLQNDLRAFLVILIESFSVITISWGIPIFLTMYHCRTLYVVSIAACPQIKNSLAFFLFTDLFNSSTNCLLYSLSGKLFRRKFLLIITAVFTCGRGILWNRKQHSLLLQTPNIELHPSNEPSALYTNGVHSRVETCRQSELLSSIQINKLKSLSKQRKILEDDGSSCLVQLSDEQPAYHETEAKFIQQLRIAEKIKRPQRIKSFLIAKVYCFSSADSRKEKTKLTKDVHKQRDLKITSSLSSSSSTGHQKNNPRRREQSYRQRHSSRIILLNTDDTHSVAKDGSHQNITTL